MLSESVADYLTDILRLEESGQVASTSELADRLQVARPSVTGMLKRMADDKLVIYEPYRGVTLTGLGRRQARVMLRRHRLVETFLVRALGMAPDRVHDEAHRWEHAVSDDAIERIDHWLGRPKVDPHGTVIPTKTKTKSRRANVRRLSSLDAGVTAVIVALDSRDPDHLAYLTSLGLVPSAEVTMIDRRPFAGPMTLVISGQQHTVGPEVTEYVTIRKEPS